jgi:hypothetical protein
MKTKKRCPRCGEPLERLYFRHSIPGHSNFLNWGYECRNSDCRTLWDTEMNQMVWIRVGD